jgi:hypothetical protein
MTQLKDRRSCGANSCAAESWPPAAQVSALMSAPCVVVSRGRKMLGCSLRVRTGLAADSTPPALTCTGPSSTVRRRTGRTTAVVTQLVTRHRPGAGASGLAAQSSSALMRSICSRSQRWLSPRSRFLRCSAATSGSTLRPWCASAFTSVATSIGSREAAGPATRAA